MGSLIPIEKKSRNPKHWSLGGTFKDAARIAKQCGYTKMVVIMCKEAPDQGFTVLRAGTNYYESVGIIERAKNITMGTEPSEDPDEE